MCLNYYHLFKGTPNAQQSGKKNKKKGGETPGVGGTPKPQQSPQSGQTPQKRTIEGGVSVEDLKVGNGGVAKPGRLVSLLHYISLQKYFGTGS